MLRFRNSLTGVIVLIRKTRRVHTRDSDAFIRFPQCQDWTDGIKEYGAELFQKVRKDMEDEAREKFETFQREVAGAIEEIHDEADSKLSDEVKPDVQIQATNVVRFNEGTRALQQLRRRTSE